MSEVTSKPEPVRRDLLQVVSCCLAGVALEQATTGRWHMWKRRALDRQVRFWQSQQSLIASLPYEEVVASASYLLELEPGRAKAQAARARTALAMADAQLVPPLGSENAETDLGPAPDQPALAPHPSEPQ